MIKEISVVIPAHNEEGNIEKLVEKTEKMFKDYDIGGEIIVVDDKSSDNTLQNLLKLKAKAPHLKVLSHEKNCGQSRALLTGIKNASYEIIATMDGDGQNDPFDIPKLLEALEKGDEDLKMVAGFRKKRKDTIFKKIASRVANKIRAFLLKDDTPDSGCGIKVFYKETFLSLPYFDHMHRFLPALFQREGAKVISVEVNHFPRVCGKSHYNNFQRGVVGVVDLLGVMWLQRRSCLTSVHRKDNI
ncbi:MAG: glycosyltransferase family 2 protein [Epsilonproteobacteria bacterium]|nr:glycosyltransferase family 2 protein [Campylobacterota bacterium]